ncbi:MAG: Uridylate kinase [Methanomassiliicoccales archaeon PtaU1.Bin124]|nr:MAG: Uridylate kinase [Methanomassiliicoccales archaeon PtaU1.Bin124]
METVVVSLGGSVLIPGENDSDYLLALAKEVRALCKDRQVFLVCGGGKVARYYITQGREMGAPVPQLDEMGIMVTRINARLLQLALGDAAIEGIPTTPQEAKKMAKPGHVVVMGGTVPGHTTDAVSAMLAEETKAARIVNATSVDAAFTADPRKHPEAKRLKHISFQELYDLVNKGAHGAGPSDVFDRLGADIAMSNRIPIYIVNGRNLKELRLAIEGKEVQGTYVGD